MRLYKFLPADLALWDLIERKIKRSQFQDMNDPFELRGIGLSNADVQRFLVSDADEHNGALCLRRGWNNPMLWSHYGDKHRGICLGLDISAAVDIQEPVYVESWEEVDADIFLSAVARGAKNLKPSDPEFQDAQKLLMKMYLTKFKAWSYEDEARIFIRLKEDQKQGNLYFAEFDENIRPSMVIVGARCSLAASRIEAAISGYALRIKVVQAMLSPNSFEVIEDVRGLATHEAKARQSVVRSPSRGGRTFAALVIVDRPSGVGYLLRRQPRVAHEFHDSASRGRHCGAGLFADQPPLPQADR
jgi:DUF2971 family protein